VLSYPLHAAPSHLAPSPIRGDASLGASRELAQIYDQLSVTKSRAGGRSVISCMYYLPSSWEEGDWGGRSGQAARQTNHVLDHWMSRWTVELSRLWNFSSSSPRTREFLFLNNIVNAGAKGVWAQKHLLLDFQAARLVVSFYLAEEPPLVEAKAILETILEDEHVRTVFWYLPAPYHWVSRRTAQMNVVLYR
jgi:hypothetical protein